MKVRRRTPAKCWARLAMTAMPFARLAQREVIAVVAEALAPIVC
jgi:hypothetical protein